MVRSIKPFVIISIISVLIAKVFLWFGAPLLTDEAYFIEWGQHFDLGYYDHTPMVGWVVSLMSIFGNHYLWYRFFPFAAHLIISYLVYDFLKEKSRSKAVVIAALFWASLGSLFHFPVLNDTALFFFASLSIYFFLRHMDSGRVKFLNLSIFMLGMSFLSKYLAVFLGVSYLIVFLVYKREKTIKFLLRVAVVIAPFVLLNLYWNYNNCWNNIMFNAVNRHSNGMQFMVLEYVLNVVLLLNPFVFWQIIKVLRNKYAPYNKIYFLTFVAPLLIFLMFSFKQLIGGHWLLPFLPFGYILLVAVPEDRLLKVLKLSLGYSLSLFAAAVYLLINAEQIVLDKDLKYSNYLYIFHPTEICEVMSNNISADTPWFTVGYPPSAILGHVCGKDIPTIFADGVHGRQSDNWHDFREYDGRDLAIYIENKTIGTYNRFFERYEVKEIPLRKGHVKIYHGYNFNYEKYREVMLTDIRDKYYKFPKWLPEGKCYIYDRYFPGFDRFKN